MSSFKSVDELIEAFRLAGVEWAKRDGEASKLEYQRKIVRSQIFLYQEGTMAEREALAEASEEYQKHIAKMVKARTNANIARARYDALRQKFEAYRTASANRRAEQSL